MNAHPGLCATCAHCRKIENRRNSVFWLCGRAAVDPAMPRYPVLPVLRCRGYEQKLENGDEGGDAGE